MISTILFTLSAFCFAGMFSSRKPSRAPRQAYSYYVCDAGPMPTWKRKAAPMARVAELAGRSDQFDSPRRRQASMAPNRASN
jgi:hypothetical protein